LAVLLDQHTAAAGGHDNGLDPLLDVRPPGVDVPPHGVKSFLLSVEVIRQRAAAADFGCRDEGDADAIQHSGDSRIDAGGYAGLDATLEHQHAASMTGRGPGRGRTP